MKRLLMIMFLALLFLGCNNGGGGGSDPVSPSHAPSISNLHAVPMSIPIGYGGGAVTVTGTFDYIDIGGDITTLRITSSCGADITAPFSYTGGSSVGGTAAFMIAGIDTTAPLSCIVNLWVVDSQGSASNKLSGTFTVYYP